MCKLEQMRISCLKYNSGLLQLGSYVHSFCYYIELTKFIAEIWESKETQGVDDTQDLHKPAG